MIAYEDVYDIIWKAREKALEEDFELEEVLNLIEHEISLKELES